MRPEFVKVFTSFITKRIKKCPDKKEHISHQSAKEGISMVLENAWHPLTEEKFLLEEEQKEEKNYLYPLRQDTKNK